MNTRRKAGKTFCAGGAVLMLLALMLFPVAALAGDGNGLSAGSTDKSSWTTVDRLLRQAYRFTREEDSPAVLARLAQVQPVSTSTSRSYLGISTPWGLDYWQLPEETEKLGSGDCEDRAIWLYVRLLERGYTNIRLMVGKYQEDKEVYHVWVNLYGTVPGKDGKMEQTVYILDPTMDSRAWPARSFAAGYYVPLYSFYKDQRWEHAVPPS